MQKRPDGTFAINARWVSVAIAVCYGILGRIAFGMGANNGFTSTLSWGFITLVPLAIGALTVFFAPAADRYDWGRSMRSSATSSLIFLVIAFVMVFEVFICILMAAPFFIGISMIGGLLMCWILRQTNRNYSVLALLLVLPYIVSPIENRFVAPDDIRTVDAQILINASAETVWQNIIRVSEIMPEEQRFDIFHIAGVPKPIRAELALEGERVGGVRRGTFDNGLVFIETINEWQPLQYISFDIHVQGRANVPAPFNEIGGRYFEVLGAAYRLEVLSDNQVLLHLSSTHRLSTNFNFYGSFWTDWMMRDLQDYILDIVKARCEAQ